MPNTFIQRLEPIILLAIPLSLGVCTFFQGDQSALFATAFVVICMAALFFLFDRSQPALRQLMPIVVLSALAVAGRVLFAPLPYIKPVSALCILGGAVYGRRAGFYIGAFAALFSNIFFGQGPWTPWQMYAWGMVGYIAGMLVHTGAFEKPWFVLAYGFISGLLFGFIMNTFYLVGYVHPITWQSALIAYGAGLGFDITHGIATAAFLGLVYLPWKVKLARIKQKYDMLPTKCLVAQQRSFSKGT